MSAHQGTAWGDGAGMPPEAAGAAAGTPVEPRTATDTPDAPDGSQGGPAAALPPLGIHVAGGRS